MSVRIRLRRMGRKKQPHYRVVVADSHSPRDGRIVENLGYYKPKSNPARLVLDLARVDYWIEQGAEPSDTVTSLVSKARRGGTAALALGEPDLEVQRKRESDALAARRSSEKKDRDAKATATVMPQDTGKGEPAASSASDDSAADVMAKAEPTTSPPKGRKGKKAGEEDAAPEEAAGEES
jgi:small subunit ribosomal protein S16